jgi:hypothetical protein
MPSTASEFSNNIVRYDFLINLASFGLPFLGERSAELRR